MAEIVLSDCKCKAGVVLKIERCDKRAILPEVTKGNAGIDLRVLTPNEEPVIIAPDDSYMFHTGLKFEIDENYYVEIAPRSSTGVKLESHLKNTIGIIDPNYRGEVLVFLRNYGDKELVVEHNQRLLQMIVHRIENVTIQEVEKVSETTRGEGGFGSTGKF